MTPLLVVRDARVEEAGTTVLEGLEFVVNQPGRIALVGAWRSWFRLFTRQASLLQGSVEVRGAAAASSAAAGLVGIAPREWLQPPSLGVAELLERSAALLGHGKHAARDLARDALKLLGAEALGALKLRHLSTGQARVVSLAHAAIGRPELVLVEDPFSGIPAALHGYLLEALERVAYERAALVHVPELELEGLARTFVERCERVLVLERGGLVADGKHADIQPTADGYWLTVTRHALRFLDALERRGVTARAVRADGIDDGVRSTQFAVKSAEGVGTSLLLEAALEADAPVRELTPQRAARGGA